MDAIDLTLRSEQTPALSATIHDANLTKIQTAVNLLIAHLNASESYAEAYMAANGTATTVAVGDTWYAVAGDFTQGHVNGTGVSFSATTDLITLPAGTYVAHASFTHSGGNIADVLKFCFAVAAAAVETHLAEVKIADANDQSGHMTGILVLATSGTVGLMLKNVTGARNITVKNCVLTIQRIN